MYRYKANSQDVVIADENAPQSPTTLSLRNHTIGKKRSSLRVLTQLTQAEKDRLQRAATPNTLSSAGISSASDLEQFDVSTDDC